MRERHMGLLRNRSQRPKKPQAKPKRTNEAADRDAHSESPGAGLSHQPNEPQPDNEIGGDKSRQNPQRTNHFWLPLQKHLNTLYRGNQLLRQRPPA